MFLLFLLIPVCMQALFGLATVIPYIGPVISELVGFLSLALFYFIGQHAGEKAIKASLGKRTAVLTYMLLVCTFTFTTTYVVGRYTFPIKFGRAVAAEKHIAVTHEQASGAVSDMLREETGSDGVIAYAIYSERESLSSHSFGEFASKQFEDIDDLEGIIAAVLNIILHAIPLLLKLVLCDWLKWVSEPGFVGLGFWYLFSVAISYTGYRVKM